MKKSELRKIIREEIKLALKTPHSKVIDEGRYPRKAVHNLIIQQRDSNFKKVLDAKKRVAKKLNITPDSIIIMGTDRTYCVFYLKGKEGVFKLDYETNIITKKNTLRRFD